MPTTCAQVLVATSDGVLNFDRQPLARMSVFVLAREGDGAPQQGHSGGGGRYELDLFQNGTHARILRHGSRAPGDRATRTRWKRRRASRSWCSAPAGRACCCTKPSATGSKPISIARAFRRSAAASASRWQARSARWSTTAPSAAAAALSMWTTKATRRSATC